ESSLRIRNAVPEFDDTILRGILRKIKLSA
ncbi:MAG: hypothetical protein ACI9V1_003620, partial [Spirosomataceae bacterium]